MAKEQRFTDFIVQLYTNKSSEDREKTTARLREQFEDCDSRLSDLVKENRTTLSSTVELCGKVIRTVNDSKSRCRELKERIIRCQSLLHCNRDNIRRMWLESLEHKYAHRMLSEIKELRKTPQKVRESLIDKKLEHATEVIVASVKLLDGNMCNAEAIKDLRSELYHLQDQLYIIISEDLRKSLQMTDFVTCHYGQNLEDVTYDDVFSNKIPPSDHSFKELLSKVSFDQDYVTVLLKCAVTMKKLPDAVDVLKESCQPGLVATSQEISKLMCDTIAKSVECSLFDLPTQRQHIFLVDLVEHTIAIFRKILDNYKIFFQILQNITEINDISDVQFQVEDVFSKLQSAVENFISLYLESQQSHFFSSKDSFSYESSQNIADIGSFFNPLSSTDDKSLTLFKFSNSCHGISMKKYSKEAKVLEEELFSSEETEKVAKPILVCRPTLRNITLFFGLLKDFVSEIEQSLDFSSVDHCPLHAYLCDCTNMFLDHVNSDINKMLKSAAANLDAWNTVPVGDGTSSEKEVLSCSLILENILRELRDLMKCLPDYSTHFFRIVYYVILDYKDTYLKAFKQMFEEDLNILSVSWARDRDIRRLMKSFLNWRHLEDEEAIDVVESPEEVRLRNREESELLIRNLRAEDETPWEVIADSSKLSNLALLQENLMWFSVALLKFVKDFGQPPFLSGSFGENSVIGAVSGLRKVIKEYEDFADTCLLALHLEVRARCFHYLQPLVRREVCSAEDIESAVKCLTGDLLQMDEVLLPILTQKEFKYVFEGVGELVASLMILVVSNMSRASEKVVRAVDRGLFVVQCCLGSITMARESSLERARGFIELLGLSPEEILDQVVEERPRFAEKEYASVLRLVSSEAAPEELQRHLEKLERIFKSLAFRANEAPGDVPA